jgi:hypothetical protein
MPNQGFLAVGWNNGSHHQSGAGYGLKISAADRDAYFKREWGTVDLYFPGISKPATVNVKKPSFWGGTCKELISREIGGWLISNRIAPWPSGSPPQFRLMARGPRAFEVRPASLCSRE